MKIYIGLHLTEKSLINIPTHTQYTNVVYSGKNIVQFYCQVVVTHFDYWGSDNNLAFKEKNPQRCLIVLLAKEYKNVPKQKETMGRSFHIAILI